MDLAPQRPLVGRGLGAVRDLASPIELGARLNKFVRDPARARALAVELGLRPNEFGF